MSHSVLLALPAFGGFAAGASGIPIVKFGITLNTEPEFGDLRVASIGKMRSQASQTGTRMAGR